MRSIMTTILTLTLLAGTASAQDWQKDLDTAEKLLASGYHDAAQEDFEAILRKYEANGVAVSRGWFGLARVHSEKNEPELAKSSLEEVLKLNADPSSAGEARGMYGQLKQQADYQVQQSAMAMQFMEYRYYSIPWYNVLAKAFTYYDLRSVKQQYEKAQANANTFNPRYLISDGPPPQASEIAGGTTGTGSGGTAASGTLAGTTTGGNGTSGHIPAGGTLGSGTLASVGPGALPPASGIPTGGIPTGGTPVTLPGASPASGEPLPTVVADNTAPPPSLPPVASEVTPVTPSPKPDVTAKPSPAPAALASEVTPPTQDLSQLQASYQNAYRELQGAMQSGDAAKIRETSGRYQTALRAYRDAAFKEAQ